MKTLYKCIMEITGAIWKQVAHTTYHLLFHHVMPTSSQHWAPKHMTKQPSQKQINVHQIFYCLNVVLWIEKSAYPEKFARCVLS